MKKVIIISTSLRTGSNSDMLANQFIEGAKAAGHEVEKISLAEKDIKFCKGCLACQKLGKCVIKDDANDIMQKVLNADVVCWATPIYYYEMSGQMKTLIDRTLPRYTEIRDKEVYFIATAAAGRGAMERTVDAMRGFTDCLPGAQVKGVIYGSGVYQKGEVMDTKAFQEAYQLGKKV